MKRRTLLKAAAALSVAGAGAVRPGGADEAPALPGPVPRGAADCHIHIYDSRYPVAPNAVLLPPDARIENYRLVQRRLGMSRAVVVQPTTYGTDNRCMLAALAALGEDGRGIAGIDTGISDETLRHLAAAGVRGIRINLIQTGAAAIAAIEPLARRVAPLGWHVQLQLRGDQVAEMRDLLGRLPVPIVFDNLAHIPPAAGARHPAFAVVRRLIEERHAWVKISSIYQDSAVGPPSYADIGALAAAFVNIAPHRMLWGSGWPHPTQHGNTPDDAILLACLFAWVPDEAKREQILVTNPEALYGFAKA